MTEEQAKETGRQIKVGKFKLGGAGASVVYDDRAGLVKIVGDPEYGEILGAHIVGNIACDMISEIVNVMALEGGYPELQRIIHPASDHVGGGARRRPRRRRLGDPRLERMRRTDSRPSATGSSRSRSRCWSSRSTSPAASISGTSSRRSGPRSPSFFVSFWVIGIIWVNHHGVLDHLKRADRGVLYLNLLVLMTVVFIPFATALMAEHLKSGADEEVAAAVYSGAFLAMGDRLRAALDLHHQSPRAARRRAHATTRSGRTIAAS